MLKKVIGDKLQVQTILPELEKEQKIILELEVVKETRTQQLQNRSILEYLIKWKNLLIEDVTWKDENFIKSIQKYSSVKDNTFLMERGMLGPYNTSNSPITLIIVFLIVIFVPLLSPYCYYCAP